MKSQEPFDMAHKAIDLMQFHQVPVSAETFELWYTYAAGINRKLSDAVDAAISSNSELDETVLGDIAKTHLGQVNLEAAAFEATEAVSNELADALSLLQTAGDDTEKFDAVLQGVSGSLSGKTEGVDLSAVVSSLLQATQKMSSRTKELEDKLKTTTSKVETLRTNLDDVKRQASTDNLTGLGNRRTFDEQLEYVTTNAAVNGEPLAMIFGDIDHFKSFNDTWGHHTGDQVLKLVAMCIKDGARDQDIPTRYGGEEFAIFLPGTSLEEARALGEEIRKSIESKRVMKRSTGQSLGTITVSFGVSQYREGETAGEFVARADACLYAAKDAGRNRVLTESEVDLGSAGDAAAAKRSQKMAS